MNKTLQIARAGHILWCLGYDFGDLLKSVEHHQEVLKILVLHWQHTNLTQLECQALLNYCQYPTPEMGTEEFSFVAARLTRFGVNTDAVAARRYYLAALDKLRASPSLTQHLGALCIKVPVDRRGLRPQTLEDRRVEVPEIAPMIDGDGRREMLLHLLGGESLGNGGNQLEAMRKFDRQIVGICEEKMTPHIRLVATKLFGIGVPRIDVVGVMAELQQPHVRVVRRDRQEVLGILGAKLPEILEAIPEARAVVESRGQSATS